VTNYAKVGGILSIISGAFGVLGLFFFIFMIYLVQYAITLDPYAFRSPEDELALRFVWYVYGGLGVFSAILGIIAIIGGVYALKRRLWGLALAGSICGTIIFLPTGIPAIIFTAMGKREFNPTAAPPPSAPVYQPPPPPPTTPPAPPAS